MAIEQVIWDAVFSILQDNEASLRIDAREVSLWRQVDEAALSQKAMPVICIERPTESDSERFDSGNDRGVWTMRVLLFDNFRPHGQGEQDARVRLGRLRRKIYGVLRANETLGLAEFGVLGPFWSFGQATDEPEMGLATAIMQECELEVPVIVPLGWTDPADDEDPEEDPTP